MLLCRLSWIVTTATKWKHTNTVKIFWRQQQFSVRYTIHGINSLNDSGINTVQQTMWRVTLCTMCETYSHKIHHTYDRTSHLRQQASATCFLLVSLSTSSNDLDLWIWHRPTQTSKLNIKSHLVKVTDWTHRHIQVLVTAESTKSTQPCNPLGSLNRVLALIGWGKGRNVTSAGRQATLCDSIWHASSRSGKG